jgi:hypothetical protein
MCVPEVMKKALSIMKSEFRGFAFREYNKAKARMPFESFAALTSQVVNSLDVKPYARARGMSTTYVV